MGKFNYTKQQEEVLNDNSNNLLVSASAGSGKTATVIQKIFNLLVNDIDLQELLVITFTDSASMEMKLRLKEKLFSACEENSKLLSQIEKLPTSDISTIHGFCSKMLRKFFYKLNLNANFAVLNENDAKFLKATALDKVITKYSVEGDSDFVTLSTIFGGGRNFSNLKSNILSYYDFLCAVEDKDTFKNKIALLCYNNNLNNSTQGKFLNDYLLSNIYYLTCNLKTLLTMAEMQHADYYEDFILQLLKMLEGVKYTNNFLKNRQEVLSLNLPRITTKKQDDNNKDFKLTFKPFYDEMQKNIKELKKMLIDKDEEEVVNDLNSAKGIINKFSEVTQLFEEEYTVLKEKRNALDFADLEQKFLELLNDEEVSKELSSTYKYIFVDEYQDINSVQEKILKKLTDKNKMVMVGDIKQSIYGFRNSTPSIFVNKSLSYSNDKTLGTLINLNQNFRSNPIILQFINNIFNRCMFLSFGGVDYEKQGQLDGKTKYEKVSNLPEVEIDIINSEEKDEEDSENDVKELEQFSYPYSVLEDNNNYASTLTMARKEGIVVANHILNIINQPIYIPSENSTRKISFGDIAILCRSNEFLKELIKVLLEKQIPLSTNMVDNIYKNKDVSLLVSLLKVISNSHDDISLNVVLSSVIGGFSFDELGIIRSLFSLDKYFWQGFYNFASANLEEVLSMDKVNNDVFDIIKLKSLQQKVNEFLAFISQLRARLNYDSIYSLLNFVQEKFDFLNYFKSLPDGANRYKIVKSFIDGFKDTEYNYDLNKYLDFVDNFALDAKFATSLNASNDSVKLGTIHSSKGLEYPVVFLVGCGKSFSNLTFREEILKDKDLGLGLNTYNLVNYEKCSNLARNAIMISLKKQEKAEELRLLYVALTRAKNHLFVIGQINLNNLKQIKSDKDSENANCFLQWIVAGLTDLGFNLLRQNKASFCDKQNEVSTVIKVYEDKDFCKEDKIIKPTSFNKEDKEEVKNLINLFNYKFEKNSFIALKNTVSSMLQEHNEEGVSFNSQPKKLTVTEDKKQGLDATKLGTIYHNIMQKIDFSKSLTEAQKTIEEYILNAKIEDRYLPQIDKDRLIKCVKTIKDLNPISVKKEQPFLSYLPYNFIFPKSDIKDKILIQGVADILVKTDKGVLLIDYKTTKANLPDQLVAKYDVQLKLYKICLEKALNIKIDNSYIYSFVLNKLIKVN